MSCQKAVALGSYVAYLQFQIPSQFAFDGQVVLRRILTSHFRLELAEKKNWTEHAPVHWLPAWRIQDTVVARQLRQTERIGVGERPTLIEKRSVEESIERERATSEWRLSAELFKHELLNWVVEQTPSSLDTCLT